MSREHHHANLSCSFCRKGQREVRKLIAGSPTVHICDECVLLCADILGEEAVGEQARALAQLKVQEAESKAQLERVRAELKRTESERTGLERVLWLAQHPDAKRVAIMALHFARACDEAQDVSRPVAERARSLAKEIEGLVHR